MAPAFKDEGWGAHLPVHSEAVVVRFAGDSGDRMQLTGGKFTLRCKNMWTLGLALWMFGCERQPIRDWLNAKFAKNEVLADANITALNAGHANGETAELAGPLKQYHIHAAPAPLGLCRSVIGAALISYGLVAGAQLAGTASLRPLGFFVHKIPHADNAVLHCVRGSASKAVWII